MISNLYLAMTASEIDGAPSVPDKLAWMACHFSPYSPGLSNLPRSLPRDALLILSDRIPIHGHDPVLITKQLEEQVMLHGCNAVLLDFQRYPDEQTRILSEYLAENLTCPLAISQCFADPECTVFLPPCPSHIPLAEYMAPWTGRSIWLELSRSPCRIALTQTGAAYNLMDTIPEGKTFADDKLHCHYQIRTEETLAQFLLWRTDEDLEALAVEARNLGIERFVGLYQELHTILI